MNILNANDLKVGGVTAIETALQATPEVAISVRGERRYVVMSAAQYDYLRECELEAAWLATQTDRASGNTRIMTASQHIADMQRRLQKPPSSSVKSAPVSTVQQARAGYSAKVKVKAKAITKKQPAAKAKASSRSTKTAP